MTEADLKPAVLVDIHGKARPAIRSWRFATNDWLRITKPITADTWYRARELACIELQCNWSQVITCPA